MKYYVLICHLMKVLSKIHLWIIKKDTTVSESVLPIATVHATLLLFCYHLLFTH